MTVIRKAGQEDIAIVQRLAKETWAVAYEKILTVPQINYMLEKFYSTASLREQMEGGHEFYLAIEDGNVVGFASWSIIDATEKTGKLQKLYVLPRHQGKQLGKKLLHEVMFAANDSGLKTLLLNVNRHNHAKTFYEKQGFTVIQEEDIDIGNGYFMNDYLMEKILK